jgi:capsular polysaccharide biosynthesis protein
VVVPAAKKLGYSPNSVAGAVIATPVPQSPLIEVIAATHDPKVSVAVANGIAKQSVKYFGETNSTTNSTASHYYDLFKATQKKLQAAQVRAQADQKAFFANTNSSTKAALAKDRAEAQSLLVQTEGYRQNYINAVRGEVNVATVTLLSTATEATSNAKKRLELNLFIALVAGLFVGAALATYRANAVLRRAIVAGHHSH